MYPSLSRRLVSFVIFQRARSQLLRLSSPNAAFHTSAKAFLATLDKDLPIPTQLTPLQKLYQQDTDILLDEIKKAQSIDRLLQLTAMHLDVMNVTHVSTTFNSINTYIKQNETDPELKNLTENQVFQSLCNRVIDRARLFEPSDVVSIYNTLCRLNVESNTYVMQALLKMLCSQINELNLNQLTFLNFLLSKQRRNPLIDSLSLALPLVLQVQIDQQLDSDNIQQVIMCLRMACRSRLKPSVIEKVIKALRDKAAEMSSSHAAAILLTLLNLETPVDGYKQLVLSSFKTVSNNTDQLPRSLLLQIARLCSKSSFYDCAFFMRLCKQASREQWTLDETYELIHRMHAANFFSHELVDYLAHQVCSNTADITNVPKFNHLNLAEYFSFADYRPARLPEVLEVLGIPCSKLSNMYQKFPYFYLKMICCWAIMGYFPKDHLNRILNEGFLNSVWSLCKKMSRASEFEIHMCYLQWALEVHNLQSQFKIPANFMSKMYQAVQQKYMKNAESPLTKFLECGLGGAQFFQTAVATRNGQIIDHVLAMRSGNYPITLSSVDSASAVTPQIQQLEGLNIPHDAKIVGIIVADEDDLCTDPEILKGYMALRKRHLIKMSITPVILNFKMWSGLPDREKIPFLMREIKEDRETEDTMKSDSRLIN